MNAAVSINGPSIAKRLASCNKSSRDRAVKLLTAWLPSAAASDVELLKIWKGLFYCVWHADKLPSQIELIDRLAALLLALETPLAVRFFDAFIATVHREWSGIDFLRLDKFYLLIRRFLRHAFRLLHTKSWDPDLSASIITVLSERSLLSVDKHAAQGVNYHLAEIFFDEIMEFLPISLGVLESLLNPFRLVLERSSDKVLVNKVKANVFDRLLENGRKLLDLEIVGIRAEPEMEKLGKIPLVMRLSSKFFDSASASETLQGNRKVLFGLHDGFLKLEMDLEKSGVHVTIQPLDNAVKETDSVAVVSKRKKSKKKSSDGVKEKKSRSKKKMLAVFGGESNVDTIREDATDSDNLITFDEPMLSNLQKRFEMIAAEAGMVCETMGSSHISPLPVVVTPVKKRKRSKSVDRQIIAASHGSVNGGGRSEEKSAKKVRFSMKNNLVWKPHSPLPPQSLRVPPSATPRGSALKKGIPAGPIKETPPTVKKVKSGSLKKVRKGKKSVSPAIKRLRQLQILSA